jgi:predicted extracellular nuclease
MSTNSNVYKIAFYNTENLFDTFDDPQTADHDFLPNSELKWNVLKYKHKIANIAQVINSIDVEENLIAIGLSEVENEKVVKDLIQLLNGDWNYVYCKTSDPRGIDQVFLYQSKLIQIISHENISISNPLYDNIFLRELLHVTIKFHDDIFEILLIHWPSRVNGNEETIEKRIFAASQTYLYSKKLRSNSEESKIIIMGDLNDNPDNKSISILTSDGYLNNPFYTLLDGNIGTCKHNGEWQIFDQILYSNTIINMEKWEVSKGNIYNPDWLHYNENPNLGPFRTYLGNVYYGGYSDHFPVYIELKKI